MFKAMENELVDAFRNIAGGRQKNIALQTMRGMAQLYPLPARSLKMVVGSDIHGIIDSNIDARRKKNVFSPVIVSQEK